MIAMSYPGFYKFTDDLLQYAGTSVYAPGFTLNAANHTEYIYPVDDWYWFDNRKAAEVFWDINGASNAKWVEFGAALATDQPINEWFGGLFPLAPVLHGMISVGLGQAAQGDSRTFLAAWSSALEGGLISSDLVQHLIGVATAYDLPQSFISGLQAGLQAVAWQWPENPARFDPWEAPDGSLWVYDQPRNPDGTYIADDPDTEVVESALRWIPQSQPS
jgi:hypothetical protein